MRKFMLFEWLLVLAILLALGAVALAIFKALGLMS